MTVEFHPEAVAARRPASTWREAVAEVGKLYEQTGIADHAYTEAMINAVEEFGPYMVLVPGVAMPHAKSSAGVNRPGQVVVTLETPVEFGHDRNDPVDVLVSFAALAKGHDGSSGHMAMIQALAGVLADADLIQRIRQAPDDAALKAIFEGPGDTTN